MHAVTTFALPEGGDRDDARDAGDVIGALVGHGLVLGRFQPVTSTLLDTFDGRLHAAGLRLEFRRTDRTELVLSGAGSVPVQVPVTHAPRFTDDLPAGPLRSRLAPLLDVRALLPMLTLSARQAGGAAQDRSGKTVTSVRALRQPAVAGSDAALPVCTVEVAELAGYPKPAAALRTLLERLGGEPLAGDTLDVALAAAGADPAGFSGSPTIALAAGTPASDGYAAVLAHLAAAIDANWQGTIEDLDPEFLHDLRVAVRRTRSVLGQAKGILPAGVLDRYRAGFERLGSLTGPARDLDVYVMEWERYVAPLAPENVAALAPVFRHLEKQRRAAHTALAKALRASTSRKLMASWHDWLDVPRTDGGEPGQEADRALGAVVAQRITKAQQRLQRDGRAITPQSPAEDLHDLRKDAKKVRYLLECFGGLLPAKGRKAFVQQLKALQDNLGEHQDAEVHVTQLQQISGQLPGTTNPDTLLAMGQLIELLEQRRQAAREEFAERFGAYDAKRTHHALDQVLAGLTR